MATALSKGETRWNVKPGSSTPSARRGARARRTGRCTTSTRSGSSPRCSTPCSERNGFDTAEVDDVVMGCGAGSGDHAMDIARMAALDAGWSLDAPGRHPQPLLRLGPAGRQLRRRRRPRRVPGPRRRRRRRVDVAARRRCTSTASPPTTTTSATSTTWSPRASPPTSSPPSRASPARSCDALAVDSQNRAAEAHRRGPLRPGARADLPRRRHARPRPRGVPPPRHHRSRGWPSSTPSFEKMGATVVPDDRASPSTRRRCWPTRT